MFLSLLLPVALAEIYHVAMPWFAAPWISALAINAALAVVVLIVRRRSLQAMFAAAPRWSFWPAMTIFFGALGLVAVGRVFGGATMRTISADQLYFITVVPIAEEILFRFGIGGVFRQRGGILWGAWFSALCFAFVHASPTVDHVAHLQIGLPLGPFFLGLCCEALAVKTGRFWPVWAFHVACNATVVIFAWGDGRWLDRLGLLYS